MKCSHQIVKRAIEYVGKYGAFQMSPQSFDEALWPEMYSKELHEKNKATRTSYYWRAMYQQDPQAEGGTEWPLNWQVRTIGLDPSKGSTESKFGDYSAFVMLVLDPNGILYVDADLAIRNTSVIVEDALQIQRWFGSNGFAVEGNQFQFMLANEMNRRGVETNTHMPVYTFENQVNKLVRIRQLTPFLSQRRIRFKGDSPGARLLVEQLRDFPVADHDDGPDALEMAIRMAGHLLAPPIDDVPLYEYIIT